MIHIRQLIFLFFVFAICSPALPAPATQPATQPSITSDWGPAVAGLQCRFTSPPQVEQNAPIAVTFEFKSNPDSLPPGITRLDTFYHAAHLQMRLVNASTGKKYSVDTFDPYPGFGAPDEGKTFIELDGKTTPPLPGEFFPRSAGDMQPGDYDCTLSYATSRGQVRGQPVADEHFWNGEIVSAPLRIKVIPQVARTKDFLVPKQLHINADGKVVFLSTDAETVSFPLNNGMYIGAAIDFGKGGHSLGGVPEPDGSNAVGMLPKGEKSASVTIEIFETPRSPGHFWSPAGDGYKTLWKKTFAVTADK